MDNPIVEEVRRHREEHAAPFNYDLDAIIAELKHSESGRNWPRVTLEPRRTHATPLPGEQHPASALK